MTDDLERPGTVPPKEPPERLAIRTRPRPVVRMSRTMIGLLAGVAGIGLAAAAIWSLQGGRHDGPPREELFNVDRIARSEGLEGLPADYGAMGDVPQLGAPMPGDLGRPMLRAQEEGRMDPDAAQRPGDAAAEARRARAEQLRREREAMARSDVFFADDGAAAAMPAAPVSANAVPPQTEIPPAASAVPANGSQAAKRAFISAEPDRRIYGSADLQKPRSPYQLMAGSVIPAALVTGINSDLPGQAIATVTANVYDSVSGRHMLIPQGARLIGRYDSAIGYAQSRLLLVWERLIFPDGSSILLDNLPGVDAGGQAGLHDRVDQHLDRLIGGAALATLLGVGAELAAPNRSSGDGQVIIATRDSAQEVVSEVGQQITRRNLDVQPTLTIRPGFPMHVLVQRDLVLRPVEAR
ncbi:conjugative transfer protein TrbI [Sphingobium sp. C100]|uniref:TrbI/VirB10 family protein n=1 Tax=Sphingobium sp. C100 TaxID=1207055 RepID=UPI0003D5EF28|nr:TrbI/VirB10 family protein [Sphingobium sp. C100]ETI64273.1 conjugative transfer protein TrbI [Sphingobium sp. C100]